MVIKKRQMRKWGLLPALLSLALTAAGCGDLPGAAEEEEESNSAATTEGVGVVGSLNLQGSSLRLTADYKFKASYADADEDEGSFDPVSGAYSISTKEGLAFSLTLFVDGSPECNWMFKIGDSQVGSFQATGSLDLGTSDCVDGQVVISEDKIQAFAASDYRAKVLSGEIDATVKAALFDEKGQSLIPLSGIGGPDDGPGGPDDCHDCGGPGGPGPGEFHGPGGGGVTPEQCRAGGYNVPEFFQYGGEGDHKIEDYMPTLYFTEEADGTSQMSVVETDPDSGDTSVQIFSNLKVTGFNTNFTFVGDSPLDLIRLKEDVASDLIRELLERKDSHNNFNHDQGIHLDAGRCDPLQIMNRILGEALQRNQYTNIESAFQGMHHGGGHFGGGEGSPKCSDSEGAASASIVGLNDFCYDTNETTGVKTLKTSFGLSDSAETAASTLCTWTEEKKNWRYEDWESQSTAGDCIRNKCSQTGGCYEESRTENTTVEACDAQQQEHWAANPNDYDTHFHFEADRPTMWGLCQTIYDAGTKLRICGADINFGATGPGQEWNFMWHIDHNYLQGLTLAEADSELEKAELTGDGNFGSFIKGIQSDIEFCKDSFIANINDLSTKKEKMDTLLEALASIKSRGYIDDTVSDDEGFVDDTNFNMTTVQHTATTELVENTAAYIEDWKEVLEGITVIYNVLEKAAIKTEGESKCLIEEVDTEEKFETLYTPYKLAVDGFDQMWDCSNVGTEGSLKYYRCKVENNNMCQEWDQDLNRIKRFGMSAPRYQTGSSSVTDSGGALLTEESSSTEEKVACAIPSGAETYVDFKSLLNLASTSEGCNQISEKILAHGALNTSNSRDFPAGSMYAKLLIITSIAKGATCEVDVKQPAINAETGCWDYVNSDGTTYAAASAAAKEAGEQVEGTFTLKYSSDSIEVDKIFSKDKIELIMMPNSTFKDAEGNSTTDTDALLEELANE